jgi:hypothetical protein
MKGANEALEELLAEFGEKEKAHRLKKSEAITAGLLFKI